MTRANLLTAQSAWAMLWMLIFLASAALLSAIVSGSVHSPHDRWTLVVVVLVATAAFETIRAVVIVRSQRSIMSRWSLSRRTSHSTAEFGTDQLPSRNTRERAGHAYRRIIDPEYEELAALLVEVKRQLEEALLELKRRDDWLESQGLEIEWFRAELARRTKVLRRVYRVLTIGLPGAGKTALTLKWANPLMDLGVLQGTKIDRYERTVSQVAAKDALVEHVLEVADWAGETIDEIYAEILVNEFHGLLLVVDLASHGTRGPDPARIQRQLEQFSETNLRLLFTERLTSTCKTVVLFINKSDVLSGTPSEVEAAATQLYAPLLSSLEPYRERLDIRVMVGSATFGHSTHHLFAHFVDRLLPKTAYDSQLLQRMKDAYSEKEA